MYLEEDDVVTDFTHQNDSDKGPVIDLLHRQKKK